MPDTDCIKVKKCEGCDNVYQYLEWDLSLMNDNDPGDYAFRLEAEPSM